MVHVVVAGDVAEAEEIRTILRGAGIESEIEPAEVDSLTVLVPEASLDDAKDAIEAMTEPDELFDDA